MLLLLDMLHIVCNNCWCEYLTSQLNLGAVSINTTCPGMKCKLDHNHKFGCACNEKVSQQLFTRYVTSHELLSRYHHWLIDSFVEGQRSIKWCPKPNCNKAIYSTQTGGTRTVTCQCGYSWCFTCGENSHQPAPCDLVHKWLQREKSDDATQIWLDARTKKCPRCDVRIEKNKACNHMTCIKCNYNFCLTGDSAISLANGLSVRLIDLAQIMQSMVEVPVLSYDTTTVDGFAVKPATQFLDQQEKECVELIMLDGRTLQCTPNHLILTTSGWLRADELRLSNQTSAHRIICGVQGPIDQVEPSDQTSQFAFHLPNIDKLFTLQHNRGQVLALAAIIGSLCSDGTMHTDLRGVLQLDHIIDVQQATAALDVIGVSYSPPHLTHVYSVELNHAFSRDLALLANLTGGKRLDVAMLPVWVEDPATPLCVVREFLAGYYGGGGGAPRLGTNGFTPVTFHCGSSTKPDAITGTKQLLQRLSNIMTTRFGTATTKIKGTMKADGSGMEHVMLHSSNSALQFYEKIGFRFCCHKQIRLMVAAAFYRRAQVATNQRVCVQQAVEQIHFNELQSWSKATSTAEGAVSERFGYLFSRVIPGNQQIINTCNKQYSIVHQFVKEIGATKFFASHETTADGYSVPRTRDTLPYITLSVIARRKIGVKHVYDISVADTHNFLANGITVHNCWLCKGAWSAHGSNTGGYYVCTKYDEESKLGKLSSEEANINLNQQLLQKYTYYYKRFKSSAEAIIFTQKLAQKIEKKMIEHELNKYSFLLETIDKLIASRSVLQYTYVLAYYLRSGSAKQLFEYQQSMLVDSTESLQDIMDNYINAGAIDQLLNQRKDIINRCASMDKFRLEMCDQVERGDLEDLLLNNADIILDTIWTCIICKHDNKKDNVFCQQCTACKIHGEQECKACKNHKPIVSNTTSTTH